MLLIVDFSVAGYLVGNALSQPSAKPPIFTLVIVPPASMMLSIGWAIVSTSRALPGLLGFGLALMAGGISLASSSQLNWASWVWRAGLGFVMLGILRWARRQRSRRTVDRIRDLGYPTEATMTDIDPPHPSTEASRGVLATATFSFIDEEGGTRWVRRPVFLPGGEEIPIGTKTRLWYDPGEDPLKDSSIVVELHETHRYSKR